MVSVNGQNLVLTGVPRGGTTLACQLLRECHNAVALFEPMDVASLPRGDHQAAVAEVVRFFAEARAQLLRDGTAPSKQVDGQVPDNLFANALGEDGQRQLLAAHGLIRVQPRPLPDFTLIIKHNAAFTALLPELALRFRALAIVRHPLAVLASWNSVDLPVRAGRIPAGERLDPELAARLDHEPDRMARQLIVLEWFFSCFDRVLPAQDILRYEDIVASQGAVLRTRAGLEGEPRTELSERNASTLCPVAEIPLLAEALIRQPGPWQRWYPLDTIAPLAARMLAARAG